ncbi:MAG: hypothetical protein AAF892_17510 [Cyanobacteria bacterium P01_D01_bin.71]
MAEQTIEKSAGKLQKRKIAVFDDRSDAEKVKVQLQQSEAGLTDIRIEGDINPYEEVAAIGTTVGAEAGLLTGAFLGGIVGVIFVAIYSTVAYGSVVNTSFNRFAIVALTVVGAVSGAFIGKRIRQAKAPAQKQKGNPEVPRRFQVWVEGNDAAIAKANEVLGHPTADKS